MFSEVKKTQNTQEGKKMTKEAKLMINMAESIAELTGANIDRLDLQCHNNDVLNRRWYHLDVWFDNGKEFTIRKDCTIWIPDEKEVEK